MSHHGDHYGASNSDILKPGLTITAIGRAGTNNKAVITESGGNVGIGTTTPESKLHVVTEGEAGETLRIEGDTHCYMTFFPNGTVAGRKAYIGFPGAGSTQLDINNEGNGAMVFSTNNDEKMRIDGTGNVGIGTTSPTEKLEVNGTVKATAFIVMEVD